jgi:hypothetical protein
MLNILLLLVVVVLFMPLALEQVAVVALVALELPLVLL